MHNHAQSQPGNANSTSQELVWVVSVPPQLVCECLTAEAVTAVFTGTID